jgi:GNAT superfamily N-acetyltransferase
VRPYVRSDAPGVRDVLQATYGAAAAPAELLNWLWFGNPQATYAGMVAEAPGRVVGVQPMSVCQCRDAQTNVRGAVLTGVAVHPEFRRRGIFSALVRACEAEAWRVGADFVTTMPNERSRPGFLKLGYTDLGQRSLLIRLLDTKMLVHNSVPVRGLDRLGASLLSATQALLTPTPLRAHADVVELTTPPADLESLERDHGRLFPGLGLCRTNPWWHWRYTDVPGRAYRLFELRDRRGQPAGFAVLRHETRHGLEAAYLMDIVVRTIEALRQLVAAVMDAAKAHGTALFCTVISPTLLDRALHSAGLLRVPAWLPTKRFYSVARFNPNHGPDAAKRWSRIHTWYQTLGDWDTL